MPLPSEVARERGGDVGEAAGLGERRDLGGEEEDPERPHAGVTVASALGSG